MQDVQVRANVLDHWRASALFCSFADFTLSVQVKAVSGPKHELMLYGFSDPPPLDINVAWSESHDSSVPPNAQKVNI